MDFNFYRKKIKDELTLGDYLRRARKRKKFNLEQAEKETKVSMKYLMALENGNFKDMLADIYVIGFIKRYASFLDLDADKLIKKYRSELKIYKHYGIFKIQQKTKKENVIKLEPGKKWLKTPNFIITPKLIISTFVILMFVGVLSYIWYQVKSFAASPPLDIYSPQTEQIVYDEEVSASGKTDINSELTINNEFVAVDADGKFTQIIKLEHGVNTIEIVSKNKNGKTSKRVLKILAEQ